MISYDVKRIADPVHGTIGLSDLEVRVMDTQVFQRLRNVKQLGLADYVYPGAGYSRLSHSLGACHVTGRILGALRRNDSKFPISEENYQLYRVAAQLHDIGHYPFSHAMEEALKEHYKTLRLAVQEGFEKPLDHEEVGREIITHDAELCEVLSKGGIEPRKLEKVFDHDKDSYLSNIISSDLDADRMDYLLRTARHTGLPYGVVDLEYILSQLRFDEKGRFCIRDRAVRTADHFLLCRYFDYQQVSFHKTVAAFELVLKQVISALLQTGRIQAAPKDVKDLIKHRRWQRFDDSHITQKIIDLAGSSDIDENMRLKTRSILDRNAPKLIYKTEKIKARESDGGDEHLLRKEAIERCLSDWAKEFKIDRSLWYVWDKPGIAITKVASTVPVDSLTEESRLEDAAVGESIFVQDEDGNKSRPIVRLRHSLLGPLGDIKLYSLRVYVILPPGKEGLEEEIKSRVAQNIPRSVSDQR
jgi:HD superfamily phosphohydrolase